MRPGASVGTYAPLVPRQPLSAAPYANYASKVPWSGLTGVPAGFADGVDNGSAYQNVKIVAKSGGDFTTITAALNSITDTSTTNRYLVWVAPGVYTERVTMKPYVDIEGAGELTTKITFGGSAAAIYTGTVVGASNAELRFLTVENTGSDANSIAIYNISSGPRLSHVTASASAGITLTIGVYNYQSSAAMTNVTASALGGAYSYGVYNSGSNTLTNVTASATGGTNNYGVYNLSASTMMNVTASASGGMNSYGVYNDGSSPLMTNVTANASGGTDENDGVSSNNFGSPTMTNVTASASGGTNSSGVSNNFGAFPTINNSVISGDGGTINCGICDGTSTGLYVVRVNNSQISGSTYTILSGNNATTRVGASQLNGGPVHSDIAGNVTCAGVYDENYTFYANTCP